MGRGDPISAGNLDLWDSISAGNLDRGIPSLQETQVWGRISYLQETEIGGSHICRKPRWGGGEPISAGNLGHGDPISPGNLDGGGCDICTKHRWWGGWGVPYLQEI